MTWVVIVISMLLTTLMSFVIIWGFLVFITFIGIYKLKSKLSSTLSLVYYYAFQEALGFMFLVNLNPWLDFVALMGKGGFSPLHVWLNKVLEGSKLCFVWFLTMQKLPYYVVIPSFMGYGGTLVLYLGSFISLLQGLFTGSFLNIYFFILTSSGNFMLVCGYWDYLMLFIICPIYLIFMYTNLNNFYLQGPSYEVVFVIMGFPINMPFYVKLVCLYYYMSGGTLIVFLFLLGLILFMVVSLPLFFYGGSYYTSNKVMVPYLWAFLFLGLTVL